MAQKILAALAHPFHINENELHIGSSIGIALYPLDGNDVDTLLKHSDIAMYQAKETGGNHYRFFSAEMNRLAMEKYALSMNLRHAIERNELTLHFQPVISLNNQQATAFEVLLRWQHKHLGMIPPLKFISIDEEMGIIAVIGE